MASFTFNTLHQKNLFSSFILCKYPLHISKFNSFSYFPTLQLQFSELLVLRSQLSHLAPKYPTLGRTNELSSTQNTSLVSKDGNETGLSSLRSKQKRVVKKSVKNLVSSVKDEKERLRKDESDKNKLGLGKRREIDSGNSSFKSKDENNLSVKASENVGGLVDGDKMKDLSYENDEKGKGDRMNDEVPFRLKLGMCSKKGDVMGAIKLFDEAKNEGIKLGQYRYTVILYLCSSAALGVVKPAKSGSSNRRLNPLGFPQEVSGENSMKFENYSEKEKQLTEFSTASLKEGSKDQDQRILVSEELKKYALIRGFEIYEQMCLEKVPMNEATLTSVARMAMSTGNGDMAFDMVKQMIKLGIDPKLRSYGPALSAFCNNGHVDKAFAVEKHMLEHGVYPEEPELEALLRVSIKASKADKVYYLLHKLRTSVRQVSQSTADLIVSWFKSKFASKVGKTKWDQGKIKKAMENGGGGWHGLGWLGKGQWNVSSANVGEDGLCKSCGEKLATIDLDPIETENFAKSVETIAIRREKNSSFQKFQKWLDYYGPFEAVIDGANVGLFSQRRFVPSKVNLVVNGIRKKLPSNKWPLIVLHNKRITGRKMDEPVNKALIEKWKNADALYATPTGSNDDWYWLYAAIKFKCLIVTNDEMRDHTFQLLGNDFFPKWKERHQVHFSFSDAGSVFHVPPPCSVVIQESDKGHWHIPIVSEHDYEAERKWLCITRANSQLATRNSAAKRKDPKSLRRNKGDTKFASHTNIENKARSLNHKHRDKTRESPKDDYTNLREILSATVFSNDQTVLSDIEAAEKLGGCVIDFEI